MEVQMSFWTPKETRTKFNSQVMLLGISNKEVFNKFLECFVKNPDKMLTFLGIAENE